MSTQTENKKNSTSTDLFVRQIEQVRANIARVTALLKASEEIKGGQDIRKAAVVFLHATLEEYLRLTEVEILAEGRIKSGNQYRLNVTLSDLDLMLKACDSFNNIITAPKDGIQNRKSINESIVALVREANQICHTILDNNIVSYKNLDKLYVQEYHIKREVAPSTKHHTNFETVLHKYIKTFHQKNKST